MAKLKEFVKNPFKIANFLAAKHLLDWVPDEPYLKLRFRAVFGRKLDLNNPKTYNEKLQWIKLYDHNPDYVMMVDKVDVKPYVARLVGKEYVIPTLGVWERVEDIDFDALPNRFVLKCTHDSGGLVICKDKNHLNVEEAKRKLQNSMNSNYFKWGREWPYKDLKPRIIAEKFIGGERIPVDYKFFCFDGKIDSVMLCLDRDKGYPKFLFYDTDWNRLNYMWEEHVLPKEPEAPENFPKMVEIAKKLSEGMGCVRIDLYNIHGKIYFGEITIFNQDGFDTDITYDTDLHWGKLTKLPSKRI